jgi:hypothetical protein
MNNQPAAEPANTDLLSLLENALRVPAEQTAKARAEMEALEARQKRAANAPIVDWQPPGPAANDLREWVRLILRSDADAVRTRGYSSTISDFNLECAETGELVRVPALTAGSPVWVKASYVRNGFGRDNRELTKWHAQGLLLIEPATIDGATHTPLTGLTAFRFGYWTARAFVDSFQSGKESPRLETAALVAGMVKEAEPELARILTNFAGGSRNLEERDRAVLFPSQAAGGQAGGEPDYRTPTPLTETLG